MSNLIITGWNDRVCTCKSAQDFHLNPHQFAGYCFDKMDIYAQIETTAQVDELIQILHVLRANLAK